LDKLPIGATFTIVALSISAGDRCVEGVEPSPELFIVTLTGEASVDPTGDGVAGLAEKRGNVATTKSITSGR
jgi:hypothetical protein